MRIENNILRYYLQNVYFITGTAYAGKSTAVRALSERYNMVFCGENYHLAVTDKVAEPSVQPDLCYMRQLKSWEDFVRRTPEEYERWIYDSQKEIAGFEVAKLIALGRDRRVIVDTNIPLETLREISDYRHVAVMLSHKSMSVERFFDRDDPEKQFLLRVIEGCSDADAVMRNFKAGLMRINSRRHYDAYANSGFFTIVREADSGDTRKEVVERLAAHFGLGEPVQA